MSPSVPLSAGERMASDQLQGLGVEPSDFYRALGNNTPILEAWLSWPGDFVSMP